MRSRLTFHYSFQGEPELHFLFCKTVTPMARGLKVRRRPTGCPEQGTVPGWYRHRTEIQVAIAHRAPSWRFGLAFVLPALATDRGNASADLFRQGDTRK